MATKHYYTGSLDYVVTPNSKDTVCIHGDESSAYCDFNVSTTDFNGYSSWYLNIATRVGNDAVIRTVFLDDNTLAPKKTVTTTIQNYFTDMTLQEINFKSMGESYSFNQLTPPGRRGFYATDTPQSTSQDFIFASRDKNAELTLNKGGSDFVFDEKGNDKYDFRYGYYSGSTSTYNDSYSGFDTIYEYKGNDEYETGDYTRASIYDVNGNDSYEASGTYSRLVINDYNGNDEYETDDFGFVEVEDYKGNDTYSFSHNMASEVNDYAGNDKYKIQSTNPENDSHDIYDYKGKDSYEIEYAKGVYINDTAGNDKYVAKNCTGLNYSSWKTKIRISEEAGNDTYQFDNVKFSSYGEGMLCIEDCAGKDKYELNNVEYLAVKDNAGNDKYSVTGASYEVKIQDEGGKDSYNVIGTSDTWINYTDIKDYTVSNDKYNLKYIYNNGGELVYDEGGNDTYKIDNCDDVYIYDNVGNDKYTVTGGESDDIYIRDYDGKDTYNIKGSYDKKTGTTNWVEYVEIDDEGDYQDTYNMQYAKDFDVEDAGSTKDVYNIKSSYGYIYDKNGDDVYNFKNLVENKDIWITDDSGNDKLNIGGTNKNNIVLLADIENNGDIYEGSIILYDKKSNGSVYINAFYGDNNSDGNLDGLGTGYIESIKVGGKKINADLQYNLFNSVKSEVAGWLSDNGYQYVEDVFLRSDNQADRNALIQIFEAAQQNM